MKKAKFLSLAALCASIVLSAGTAAACSHQHEYGEWTITTAPTETVSGKATRECSAGDNKEEVDVAPLTDTSVWTLESEEAATHVQDGKKKYTSRYGEVEVTVNKTPHTYGNWTITKQPTLTDGGAATRTCSANDNGKEEKSIAKLTDASVWTPKVNKAPTHTEKGETVYTSEYGAVTIATDKLATHNYGEWTIVKKPTMLEEGKAECECSAGDGTDEKVLPVLGDDTFWTSEVKKEASHTEKGETHYTSEYGTVVVETEKLTAHTYGAWTIDRKPDLESTGLASRVCTANDGGKEEKTLPALTDTAVWTEDTSKRVEPAATTNGTAVYTSEYGTVTITLAKLSAPFYDKTYYNFNYDTKNSNKALNTQTSWNQAHVALDGEGKGSGEAYPFRGAVSVKYAEAGSEKVTIKIGETAYDGYVEEQTGIMVMFDRDNIFVLTPYTRTVDEEIKEDDTVVGTKKETYSVSDAKASAWTYEGGAAPVYAVTYNYEENSSLNIYIDADKAVRFGVTFTDMEGKAVAAENCYNADYVYVKSGDKVIASFGCDGESVHTLDGKEGKYTSAEDELIISGYGTASYKGQTGTYTLAHDVDYTLGLSVGGSFYQVTLDGTSYTVVKPMVTITFDGGEYSEDDEKEYNANAVATLPTPASSDELYVFAGWHTDAACTTKVADNYKPTADATLYAKWVKKIVVYYVADDDTGAVTIVAGAGDIITDKLPELGVEVENNRFFVGWKYTDHGSNEKKDLPDGVELSESNSGITVYAQWQTLPSYYGNYTGKQLLSGIVRAMNLTIDEKDAITFSYQKTTAANFEIVTVKGTVQSYNSASQELVWIDGENSRYTVAFNSNAGLLVTGDNLGDIGNYPFFVTKSGEVGNNKSLWYNKVHLVEYGEAGDFSLACIYEGKIYEGVTVTDCAGTVLGLTAAGTSKTLVITCVGGTVIAFGDTTVASGKDELGNTSVTKALDGYYGKYNVGGKDYILNGLGQIDYEGKGGSASAGYTFIEEKDGFRVFDVFERKLVSVIEETITTSVYENVAYYRLKIALTESETSSFEKVMVTVTVKNATGTGTADGTAQVNAKVKTLPATPVNTVGEQIFVGWYSDEALTKEAVATAYEVGDTPTLYAKWETRVTVTVHLNYEDKTEEYEFAQGATTDIPELTRDGYYLVDLFTDETCNTKWTGVGEALDASVTVYAKWAFAAQMAGTYKGWNFYSTTQGMDGAGKLSTEIVTIAKDGSFSSTGKRTGTLNDEQKAVTDGSVVVNGSYIYFNKEAGIVWTAFNSGNGTSVGTDTYIGFVDVTRIKSIEYAGCNDFKVNGTAKYTGWLTLTYLDDSTMNVFCYNDRIYDNVTWTEGVTAFNVNGPATEIQVWDKNDNELLLKVKKNSAWSEAGVERGAYTNGEDTLFLNGGDQVVYNGTKGTYSSVSGKDYNFNVDVDGVRYWVTVDGEAKTFTIKKPMATITFDLNGHGEAVEYSQNVSKNLSFSTVFTSNPTAEGFIFRGWYSNAEGTGSSSTSYNPSDETPKTFYAKWDKAITVTLVYGNGMEDVPVTGKYVNDTYTLVLPTDTVNGLGAEGWYTTPTFDDGTKVTSSYTFTYDTTFYCKWVTPHALMGTYKGYEFYSNQVKTAVYTVTIDYLGRVSGTDALVAGENEGEYTYNNKYLYYDATSKTIIVNWGSQATWKSSDFYVVTLVNDGDTLSASSSVAAENCLMWNSNGNWIGKFKVNDVEKVFYVTDGKVYGNVSVEINGAPATNLSLAKQLGNALTVKGFEGNTLVALGWNGSTFVAQDGTQGTYTGTLNGTTVEIVANGYGGYSINGTALSITKDEDKITFVLNNSMKVITIDVAAKTYTQVRDGYEGEYTLPDGESKITLDGYGGAGEGVTYVVNGATVVIYTADSTTQYGIDKENKTLSAKSVFAGQKFINSDYHYLQFNDDTQIVGKLQCGYSFYIEFTGVLSSDKTTLTLTVTKDVGNGSNAGDTLVFTLSGNALTLTSSTSTKLSDVSVNIDMVYTCEDFSL